MPCVLDVHTISASRAELAWHGRGNEGCISIRVAAILAQSRYLGFLSWARTSTSEGRRDYGDLECDSDCLKARKLVNIRSTDPTPAPLPILQRTCLTRGIHAGRHVEFHCNTLPSHSHVECAPFSQPTSLTRNISCPVPPTEATSVVWCRLSSFIWASDGDAALGLTGPGSWCFVVARSTTWFRLA